MKYYCGRCDKIVTSICDSTWCNLVEIKESKQMTREQAVKIVKDKMKWTIEGANKWIDIFEALGLLKFKEEKKSYCIRCDKYVSGPCNDISCKIKLDNLLKAAAYDPSFKEAADRITGISSVAEKPTQESVINRYVLSGRIVSDLINQLLKYNYKIVDCDLYDVVDKRKNKIDYQKAERDLSAAYLCLRCKIPGALDTVAGNHIWEVTEKALDKLVEKGKLFDQIKMHVDKGTKAE